MVCGVWCGVCVRVSVRRACLLACAACLAWSDCCMIARTVVVVPRQAISSCTPRSFAHATAHPSVRPSVRVRRLSKRPCRAASQTNIEVRAMKGTLLDKVNRDNPSNAINRFENVEVGLFCLRVFFSLVLSVLDVDVVECVIHVCVNSPRRLAVTGWCGLVACRWC